jgi:hypothetical protein
MNVRCPNGAEKGKSIKTGEVIGRRLASGKSLEMVRGMIVRRMEEAFQNTFP